MTKAILSPRIRYYVIQEIKTLSDLEKQKTEWVSKDRNDAFWYHVINETDFLWDGSINYDENPTEHIGDTLKDEEELKAVLNLVQKLDIILEKIGTKKTDAAYLNSPLWSDVVDAAKNAYNLLTKDQTLEELSASLID